MSAAHQTPTRPTPDGKASEEETRSTPMHVGKGGRLSLAPENQMSWLDRDGKPAATAPSTTTSA